MILRNIEEAVNGPLSSEFIELVKNYIAKDEIEFTVCHKTVERSIWLSKYFSRQKRYLAGYGKNGEEEVANLTHEPARIDLMRKVLKYPGNNVSAAALCRKHHKLSSEVQAAFFALKDLGLGQINSTEPSAGGRKSVVFLKPTIQQDMDLNSELEFVSKLGKVGVTFEEYKNANHVKRPLADVTNTENSSPAKLPKFD